jgi:hypothetical protein
LFSTILYLKESSALAQAAKRERFEEGFCLAHDALTLKILQQNFKVSDHFDNMLH